MGNKRKTGKKPSKNPYVHQFADKVRRTWPDQKIYDIIHRPLTQELVDTCAQEMLEDVLAVLAPHFRKPTNEKIAKILHDWYDNQKTCNTRLLTNEEDEELLK